MRTLARWRKFGRPNEPVLLAEFSGDEFPPCGAALVMLNNGQGRLRREGLWKPHRLRPDHEDVCNCGWFLDDKPLFHWIDTYGCGSCYQYLAAAGMNGAELDRQVARIDGNTLTSLAARKPSQWVRDYLPLIAMLKPNVYWIAVRETIPTLGQGQFFWKTPDPTSNAAALQHRYYVNYSEPAFLLPTQSPKAFRKPSFDAARDSWRDRPGVAIHLIGYMAALLDGHHRATAAAIEGGRFPCVTIQEAESWYGTDEIAGLLRPEGGVLPSHRFWPSEWKDYYGRVTVPQSSSQTPNWSFLDEASTDDSAIPVLDEAERGVQGMPYAADWYYAILFREYRSLLPQQWTLESAGGGIAFDTISRHGAKPPNTRFDLTIGELISGLHACGDPSWETLARETLAQPEVLRSLQDRNALTLLRQFAKLRDAPIENAFRAYVKAQDDNPYNRHWDAETFARNYLDRHFPVDTTGDRDRP